jgi:hypothetical protein
VKRIQEAIAGYRPIKLDVATNEIREHVTRAIRDFRDSLATGEGTKDAVRAKEALANHLGKLVLTPATRDGRQVYRVTGNVTLPDADGCRMQVVVRDCYPQHSTLLQIGFSDSYLDPKGSEKPGPQCAA